MTWPLTAIHTLSRSFCHCSTAERACQEVRRKNFILALTTLPASSFMDACNSIRGALTLVKHVLDMLYQTGPPRGIEILPHEIEIFFRLETPSSISRGGCQFPGCLPSGVSWAVCQTEVTRPGLRFRSTILSRSGPGPRLW